MRMRSILKRQHWTSAGERMLADGNVDTRVLSARSVNLQMLSTLDRDGYMNEYSTNSFGNGSGFSQAHGRNFARGGMGVWDSIYSLHELLPHSSAPS